MSLRSHLSLPLPSLKVGGLLTLSMCLLGLLTAQIPGLSASPAPHTIRGMVLSSEGGAISQAQIKLEGGKESTMSDQQGRFKLTTNRSGALTLIASKRGFQTKRQPVTLRGSFIDVVVTLKALPSKERADAEEAMSEPISISVGAPPPPPPPTSSSALKPEFSARASMAPRPRVAKGKSYKRRRPTPARRRRPMIAAKIATGGAVKQASIAAADRSDEDAGGDEYQKINESDYKDPKSEPLSTFSIDVDTASYANLRRFIQNRRMPPVDAVKIEEMINYFNYTYAGPRASEPHPFKVHTELAEAPWNPEHKLLHIGLQGRRIDASKLPPNNLVFLLDVSGSMSGPDRLPLLKQALTLLSGTLRPQDKVSIVVYAGAAGLVLPPTSGSKRREIIEAFSKLRAGGSTAGGAGINLAYQIAQENFIKGGNNRVILATDGDFNVGTSSQGALVRLIEEKRKSGVFLTVLGFGRGNYRASTMSDLAEKGNGNHAYIDSILEAQKVLVSEMGGTLFTIAKDVKIQVEFNPAKVGQYRLIGYQSRILAARDFNDDKKDAGELGAGHSVTALYELIPPGGESKGSVDALKYQKSAPKASDEWLTVKLRYKKPDGDKSVLLTHPHSEDQGDWREASEDFRFSAGVAQFGMLLRKSKHLTGERDKQWANALKVIEGAKGKDDQGYRAELIDLVKRARSLK